MLLVVSESLASSVAASLLDVPEDVSAYIPHRAFTSIALIPIALSISRALLPLPKNPYFGNLYDVRLSKNTTTRVWRFASV